MNVTFLILIGVCLGGLIIRTSYELCKKMGYIGTKNIFIFAVVFAAMCAMLISWPFISHADPVKINLPDIIKWIGLIAAIAGISLTFGGLLQLKKLENTDHLVTTGLFTKIRHPMYTGFILWIFGWIINSGAAVTLLAGIFGIINILYWRNLEERNLESVYGDNYRKYREKTWF